MRKNIILAVIVSIFVILETSLITAQIPGVSSSPSPSASPSPPLCSGIATLDLRLEDYKIPNPDPTADQTSMINARDFLDEGHVASYEDFKACKVPSSFSCPSGCSVVFREAIQQVGSVSGSAGERAISNTGVVKECNKEGTITKYAIFEGSYGDIMNSVTQDLAEKTKKAMEECTCPAGSTQVVIVTITGASNIYLFGFWVGIEVYYKIDIKCVSASSEDAVSPSGSTIYANLHLEKECKKP